MAMSSEAVRPWGWMDGLQGAPPISSSLEGMLAKVEAQREIRALAIALPSPRPLRFALFICKLNQMDSKN